MKIILCFGFYLLFIQGVSLFGQVTYLERGQLKVGVLTGTGGRIVYFGLNKNILKSDTALWTEPGHEKPANGEVSFYKAYHGNMVWPSPMCEWWTKQNLFPEKRKNADRWPPDPFIIYSDWKIIEQTNNSLEWQSPDSPVSGIRITEYVKFENDSVMLFKVDFKNITDSVIHWGIWLNTAIEGKSRCFVNVNSIGNVKIKGKENPGENIPWKTESGFFTFLPDEVALNNERIYTKACIKPKYNRIAAFSENQLLIINTFYDKISHVHPEQSEIEIFNQISTAKNEELLELEFHTDYCDIEPGHSIMAVQKWMIYPCPDLKNDQQRIKFLDTKLSQINN